MAHEFDADLTYRTCPTAAEQRAADLGQPPADARRHQRVPVGHGYAPLVTVRDGDGDVAFSGPVVFLPEDSSFAPSAWSRCRTPPGGATQLGFEGQFFPTYGFTMADADRSRRSPTRKTRRCRWSPTAATSASTPASRSRSTRWTRRASTRSSRPTASRCASTSPLGSSAPPARRPGLDHVRRRQPLREAAGQPHPRAGIALGGVVLALLGLMGSLFIRPRRIWVPDAARRRAYRRRGRRARPQLRWGPRDEVDASEAPSGAGSRQPDPAPAGARRRRVVVTHAQFEVLSDQAVARAPSSTSSRSWRTSPSGRAGAQGPGPRRRPRCRSPERALPAPARRRDVAGGAPSRRARADGAVRPDRRRAHRRRGVRCTSSPWSRRGLAADPVRVPWGNMYEFTLAGTLGRRRRLPAALPPLPAVAGSRRWSPASCWSC